MSRVRKSLSVVCLIAFAFTIAANAVAKGGSSHSGGSHKSSGDVSVHGYTNKNGTHVDSHMRSHPDGDFGNNWSTKGNVNPYTGKEGTRVTPPHGYGGSALARGSSRSNRVFGDDGSASSNGDGDDSLELQSEQSQIGKSPARLPISPGIRMKWATDNLSPDEKAEHEELVEALKGRGVKLFYWDLYSNDKLHDIQHQLAAGARPSSF